MTAHDEAPTPTWLKAALPISVSILLLTVVVVLLLRSLEDETPGGAQAGSEIPLKGGQPTLAVHPSEIRRDSPTEPGIDYKPKPRGPSRWKIDPLPEGWDPEVAAKLAELFGLIDFDPMDPGTFSLAGPAWDDLQAYLASLDPDSLPTLKAILHAEEAYVLRRQILEGIGLMSESDAATYILREFFQLRSGDLKARAEMNVVLKSLGDLGNDSSFDVMNELIDSESMPAYYKDKLIVELGNHPRGGERVDLFKTVMLESRNEQMRNHSAQALGKHGAGTDLADLYDAYDREKRKGHWVVRQTILGSIGKIGDPSSIPFLEEEARFAKEDGVRLSAASALRRIGTPRARGVLQDVARDEKNPQVRQRMESYALGQ